MIIFFFLVASFGLWLLVCVVNLISTWLHSDTDLLRQYTEQQQTPK